MQRRAFLKGAVGTAAFLPLASSGMFARPLGMMPFARRAEAEGRVLVLINLNGGNDGLNTVVPITDARYYSARPLLAVKQADTLAIAPDAGLHKLVPEIRSLYADGQCAIVQNVGYPNQDRSHFRSTDIWHSASNANEVISTGWTGRYLESIHPEYPGTLPDAPFAVQISSSTTLLIQGARGSTGMAIDSPDRFFDLANGLTVSNDPVPATLAGPQIEYIRRIIVEADRYSTSINSALARGKNYVTFGNGKLSQQLQAVGRLIDGGLGTPIYVVTLGGFDTHYAQTAQHETLIAEFSVAVKTFLDDIAAAGKADNVVVLSYSEFGRRLAENTGKGTDHGAAAPQFVFGRPVLGGAMLGTMPDLGDLDSRGDVKMKIDFRQLYSTLLEDWLGYGHTDTVTLLGADYAKLPLFRQAGVGYDPELTGAASITSVAPNPAGSVAVLRFTMRRTARARISITGSDGRVVAVAADRMLEAGEHSAPIDVSGLPSGSYIITLTTGGHTAVQHLAVVR